MSAEKRIQFGTLSNTMPELLMESMEILEKILKKQNETIKLLSEATDSRRSADISPVTG